MIDFDKKINDYVTSHKGLYRRYCDDIIIVIPMTKKEVSNGRTNKISKFIYNVRDDIPNLELNEDKTEHFFYGNGKIRKLKGMTGRCCDETKKWDASGASSGRRYH